MDLTTILHSSYQQQNQFANAAASPETTKYKECMRNHAASIGGHANDGCGEFMPHTHHNGRDSFTCAACGCHRNFHRREIPGQVHCPLPQRMLICDVGTTGLGCDKIAINAAPLSSWIERFDEEAVGRMKRVRTKFTREQKDRMWEFAERIGWRINKNDGVEMDQFCSEIGIKPNVLKVWMHNNKNVRRRSEASEEPTSSGPFTPAPAPAPQAVGV